MTNPFVRAEPCWAGRKAFGSGSLSWRTPCTRSMQPTHLITDPETPGAPVIKLCDFHYQDALRMGLIAEPTPTPERVQEARELRPDLKLGEDR